MPQCACHTPPFDYKLFDSRPVGTDQTGGRYGEVSVETCKYCGALWLRYFFEYESFTGSGRWYRGLIEPHVARNVTPESASDVLATLPQWFRGGSYFGSTGESGSGPLMLDTTPGIRHEETAEYMVFQNAILTVLREALACPRWNHEDLPGAAHLTELNEIINDGNRFAAFRQTKCGRCYLEIIEAVESALNDEWLPFDILGLTLPQARAFLELALTEIELHGLAGAMPQLQQALSKRTA